MRVTVRWRDCGCGVEDPACPFITPSDDCQVIHCADGLEPSYLDPELCVPPGWSCSAHYYCDDQRDAAEANEPFGPAGSVDLRAEAFTVTVASTTSMAVPPPSSVVHAGEASACVPVMVLDGVDVADEALAERDRGGR